MDTKYKICAVVVTFNRKELLINCLNAINEQTYKPHTVIIVDNASTDGTKDLVKQNGYCNIMLNGINYQCLKHLFKYISIYSLLSLTVCKGLRSNKV